MIMIFIIHHVLEDFIDLTTDITITIPGSAICITIPTILSTGEQVYISDRHGVVLDIMITTILHTIAADIITVITHLIHSAGDILIIMVLTIQGTIMVTMMATGEVPITMIITAAATTDIVHRALQCHHTDPLQVMQVHQQEKTIVQMTPVTDHQELLLQQECVSQRAMTAAQPPAQVAAVHVQMEKV